MPKEKDETIETRQRIILPSSEDNKTDQELIDNFLSHSDEEYRQMGKEIEEAERKPLRKLKDYRRAWKEKIQGIDEETKDKIVKAVGQIPVRVEVDSGGNRWIKIKLKNTFTILDPELKKYTGNKYLENISEDIITKSEKVYFEKGGIQQNLSEYIEKMEKLRLRRPDNMAINGLLSELSECLNIDDDYPYEKLLAAFMYLTGMQGAYWLDSESPSVFKPDMLLLKRHEHKFSEIKDNSKGTLLMLSVDILNFGSVAGKEVELHLETGTIKWDGGEYQISDNGFENLIHDLSSADSTNDAWLKVIASLYNFFKK